MAEAISKHLDRITAVNLASSIDISQAYLYGPLLLLEHMANQLGISSVLSGIAQKHDRLQFNFEKAVFSMVVSRFMEPISKLGLWDRMLDRFYPGLFDNEIELHHLYSSLDLLSTHMVYFLAYLCEARMTKNLRVKAELFNSKTINKNCIKSRPLTSVQGLKELNQVLAIPIKVRNQKIWVRTDIPENAMKILNAISIKIPPKIL